MSTIWPHIFLCIWFVGATEGINTDGNRLKPPLVQLSLPIWYLTLSSAKVISGVSQSHQLTSKSQKWKCSRFRGTYRIHILFFFFFSVPKYILHDCLRNLCAEFYTQEGNWPDANCMCMHSRISKTSLNFFSSSYFHNLLDLLACLASSHQVRILKRGGTLR